MSYVHHVVDELAGHLDEYKPGAMVGLYLTGSAAMGGLRPDSDLDFVLVTERVLMRDLIGDERNVILTLARMLATISTGEIVSKDEAARLVEPDLPEPDRFLLRQAAAGYLGHVKDDWSGRQQQARRAADHLAAKIRMSAADLDHP